MVAARLLLLVSVWITGLFGLFPDVTQLPQVDEWMISATVLYAAFITLAVPVAFYAASPKIPEIRREALVIPVLGSGAAICAGFWGWAVFSTALGGGGFIENVLSGLHALCIIAFAAGFAWTRLKWLQLFALPACVIAAWSVCAVPALLSEARATAGGASYRLFIWRAGTGYVERFHWWEARGLSLIGPRDVVALAHHAVLSVQRGDSLYYWSKTALEWHPAPGNHLLDHDGFEAALAASEEQVSCRHENRRSTTGPERRVAAPPCPDHR